MTIYEELKQAEVPLDHHESDLYALKNETSERILKKYDHSFTIFISQIDHKPWYDIPFAFQPWWDSKPR